jgi:hypothetical protein
MPCPEPVINARRPAKENSEEWTFSSMEVEETTRNAFGFVSSRGDELSNEIYDNVYITEHPGRRSHLSL